MTAPVDRIRKLLALARSSNVHEAAAAAGKAQELLTRWGLTEAELEQADEQPAPHSVLLPRSRWRQWILVALCEVNTAKAIGGPGLGYCILARKADAEAIEYLLRYLCREVDRLAREAMNARQPRFPREWSRSFRLGAAREIAVRLEDAQRSARQEHAAEHGSAALVRVDAEREALEEMVRGLKKQQPTTIGVDGEAAAAGREAARHIELGSGPRLERGDSQKIEKGTQCHSRKPPP